MMSTRQSRRLGGDRITPSFYNGCQYSDDELTRHVLKQNIYLTVPIYTGPPPTAYCLNFVVVLPTVKRFRKKTRQ